MLDTVHAVSLHNPIITDNTAGTITHLSSIMVVIQGPAITIVLLPLLLRETVNGMTMTDVTGIALPHASPISTPGMVAMTRMIRTDTDAALALLHRETGMPVHTLEVVFASSLLNDIRTLIPTVRETSISCC